jgi:hypothetical protein
MKHNLFQKITLLLFVFGTVVLVDNTAFAQSWSPKYNLKKGHTIYLNNFVLNPSMYMNCTWATGVKITTNTTNNGSDGQEMWYSNQPLCYGSVLPGFGCPSFINQSYDNSNLTTDPSTSSSPIWYTSTDNSTQIQFSIEDSCGIPTGISGDLSTSFSNNAPGTLSFGGADGAGDSYNGSFEFTETSKTLVLYVAGAGADPYNLNQLLATLTNDLTTGSYSNMFDVKAFPDTHKGIVPYTWNSGHQSVAQNLITYLGGLDLTSYTNVVIITHSAGYMVVKTAILAANGTAYSRESYDFAGQKSQIQALFQKAEIFSLAPPMGGATISKAVVPIFMSQDFVPTGNFQEWLLENDPIFKECVGSFSSSMIVGDPTYNGIWSTRKDGNYEPSFGQLLINKSETIGALQWLRIGSNKTESIDYYLEQSRGSVLSLEYPISIVPAGQNVHHYLCNYKPLISSLEKHIIAAATSANSYSGN